MKFVPKKVSEPKAPVRVTSKSYGSWVYNQADKEEYWLTPDQYNEYDNKSVETDDDDAFYAWFSDYVSRHRCPKRYTAPVSSGAAKPIKSWGSWDDDDYGTGTSWWRGQVYSAWGKWTGSKDESKSRKLAQVMQIVQSTVRVIDDSMPPMTCSWASKSESYTSLEENRIVINPTPVVEMDKRKLSLDDVIKIATGLGLHEAGHSSNHYGTRTVVDQIMKPKKLEPFGVAGFLTNVIEDVRTEAVTCREYPGFTQYIRKTLDYTWSERDSSFNPAKWGSLDEALNALVVHLRWPEHSAEVLTDPSFAEELPWWDAWNDDYQQGRRNLRDSIVMALERLAQDPDRAKEMEAIAAAEHANDDMERALSRLLHDPIDGKQKIFSPCTNDTPSKDRLDDDVAEKSKKYVEEKLEEGSSRLGEHGKQAPRIWIRRPVESSGSIASYIGKPGNIIDRLKAAIQFRPELARYFTRLQRSGQIDEEELWRWGADDYRVFQRENIEVYPKANVALLVDMSGSMNSGVSTNDYEYETKVMVAQRLAQMLLLALRDMEGVTPYVFGHTGDLEDSRDGRGSADFLYLWEPGDPLTRLGLITYMDHGNNYDGYAINWVVDKMLERAQPNDQNLLIVLSDGYPAGNNYGYSEAMDHVRDVVDDAERREVYVIQIAIDGSMRPEDQSRMFKHWVPFEGADALPRQLATVVTRVLNAAAQV
jgi:hypothetical protein